MDSKGGGRRCGSLEKLDKQTPIYPLLLDAHIASSPWVAAPESGGAGGVVPAGAKANVGSAATSVGGRFTRDTCPAGDQGWVGAAVEGMGGALRPSQAQAPQAGWWASTWSYPDIPMHVHTRRRTHVYHAHKCTHRHIDTNTGIMHRCHEHTHATRGHIQEAHMHTRSKCTHMYTRGQHTCTHMYTKAHTHIHAQALRRRGAKTKEQLPTFSPERPSRPIPSPATECQTAGESGG